MAEPIGRALEVAEATVFTRPIPKSTSAQLNFLLKQAKGTTRGLAEILGVSPRQALRYRKGEARPPAEKLRRAVEDRWQPRVRERARKRMAEQGVVVDLNARFGYTAAPGTTDDPRMRYLVQPIRPEFVRRMLDARSETDRRDALADALAYHYFRDRNQRAHGLGVELTDIESIEITL